MGHIIVDGAAIEVDVPVQTWKDTGLEFMGRPRLTRVRAVVNHWTGAENSPRTMFMNMRQHVDKAGRPEPLCVHFAVDQRGIVWQFMDAVARGAHCRGGGANSWSVGIEFINRGSDIHGDHKGITRRFVEERLRGRKIAYWAMTDLQVATACRLNEALCDALGLPMEVPQKDGDVFQGVLTPAQCAQVRGVLGHLQLEPIKHDPGLELLRTLHAYGQRSAPLPAA